MKYPDNWKAEFLVYFPRGFLDLPTALNPKGQLISKGYFVFFNSPNKQTKNFCPSRLGQKFEFSSSYFGRIEDTKKTFRNQLTFSRWTKIAGKVNVLTCLFWGVLQFGTPPISIKKNCWMSSNRCNTEIGHPTVYFCSLYVKKDR